MAKINTLKCLKILKPRLPTKTPSKLRPQIRVVRNSLSLVLVVDLEVVGQDQVADAQEVGQERDLVLIDLVQMMKRIDVNQMVRKTPR